MCLQQFLLFDEDVGRLDDLWHAEDVVDMRGCDLELRRGEGRGGEGRGGEGRGGGDEGRYMW